ncbi:single-stranded DNA-binding protein [Xanthobacter sp. ZOL 2024]
MASVNKVIIVGNLGRDPEVRSFGNGGRVANLSVATSSVWREKSSGEKRERTEWHSVTIYNENLVGVAERFLKKGSKVYLEGQLETRKYEKDGRDVYSTEIVLRPFRGELVLLDGRDSASDGQGEPLTGDRGREATRQGRSEERASTGSHNRSDDFDDFIPF